MRAAWFAAGMFVVSLGHTPWARAQVWSLENMPAKHKPAMCDFLRRSIIADRKTQTYKWALKRKQSGQMWRKTKERLEFSESMVRDMRRVGCGQIP